MTKSIVAWMAGVAAVLGAIGTVLTALGALNFEPILKHFEEIPSGLEVVDEEFVTLRDASVWASTEISDEPIARLDGGTFHRIRGRLNAEKLYALELRNGRLGYASMHHFQSANEYRNERTPDISEQDSRDRRHTDEPFLFGVRVSASWETDTQIHQSPMQSSKVVGKLTSGCRSRIDLKSFL